MQRPPDNRFGHNHKRWARGLWHPGHDIKSHVTHMAGESLSPLAKSSVQNEAAPDPCGQSDEQQVFDFVAARFVFSPGCRLRVIEHCDRAAQQIDEPRHQRKAVPEPDGLPVDAAHQRAVGVARDGHSGAANGWPAGCQAGDGLHELRLSRRHRKLAAILQKAISHMRSGNLDAANIEDMSPC